MSVIQTCELPADGNGCAEQGTQVDVEYEEEFFDDETISRMLGHFRQLLRAIATDPQQRIS